MSESPIATEDVHWLAGLRVLVTGAAGVLGRALVAEAVHRGAAVVATGRSPTIDDGGAARRRDPGGGRPARSRRSADGSSTRRPSRMGGIDIVVNNAATLVRKAFSELELDDLEAAWQVNLRAPALIMQESFDVPARRPVACDRQRRLDRRRLRRHRHR